MRALTVRQPWASLIVAGVKPVENRTWPVPETVALFAHGCTYVADGTGWYVSSDLRIAVHAGKANDPTALSDWDILRDYIGTEPPPRGALLGYVTVTGCHHAAEEFVPCSRWADPGCWHWTLADPKTLDEPVPMRGRQGLWTVPDDVLAGVPA